MSESIQVAVSAPPFSYNDLPLYCTAQLETAYANEKTGEATGFLFQFPGPEGRVVPVIVSNKHVLEGATTITACFHLADAQGHPGTVLRVAFQHAERTYVPHPDPETDLAVVGIATIPRNLQEQGIQLLPSFLPPEMILDEQELQQLLGIEEVIVVGYPYGIWDDVNNLPVVRKGITATPAYSKYRGKEAFLLDAPLSVGSSGSPVFLYNPMGFATRSGDMVISRRVRLLGILSSMHYELATGEIRSIATGGIFLETVAVVSPIPMQLGVVTWAKKLRDFEPIFLEPFVVKAEASE